MELADAVDGCVKRRGGGVTWEQRNRARVPGSRLSRTDGACITFSYYDVRTESVGLDVAVGAQAP